MLLRLSQQVGRSIKLQQVYLKNDHFLIASNGTTGHSYYYNAETKTSTYTRPVETPAAGPPAPTLQNPTGDPSLSFLQYQSVGGPIPSAGGPFDGNAFGQGPNQGRGGFQGHRGGRGGHDRQGPPRPQPVDKPKSKYAIPGFEPWILVNTKLGRRFVYNPVKEQSYWRIPDKLKPGILALDQQRIKEKAGVPALETTPGTTESTQGPAEFPRPASAAERQQDENEAEDSSEYEEVEVTDDEGENEGEDDEGNPSKRQRTEEDMPEEPVEFGEDDIAFQLAAMGQEYGLDPGEYDDGHADEWEEGAEGIQLSHEDSIALFQDLLNDFGINPYTPWEKLIEDGKIIDDSRYTALNNMKERKEAWDDWSRVKIRKLREQRAKEEKRDPRIPFLAFLQEKATPKLYWPEFKRKYKKEPVMRDSALLDKDREKWYREHINRLKLPQSTLKSDLATLLKAQPLSQLNNATLPSHLPSEVLGDIRYISLTPSIRDPLVEAFITTLAPPPDATGEDDEATAKEKAEKERRQQALEERERRVAEQKRKQERDLRYGKGRLREEEAEIQRAMQVGRQGLKSHLMDVDGAEEGEAS